MNRAKHTQRKAANKTSVESATSQKVRSLRQMIRLRAQFRKQGQQVVLTNGVFDILHLGHVIYLERARAHGDVLIVGLNGDRSVRQLKGPLRPLVPQAERAAMLAALQCVDYVVIFPEKRAINLLRKLRPDVYVKGGDYTLDTLVPEERAIVEEADGRIEIMPHVRGRSTTNLIKTIIERYSPCRGRKGEPLDTVPPRH